MPEANLVTGATGILGSHVVLELLLAGRQVIAAKRKSSDVTKVEKLFSCYVPNGAELASRIKWVELDFKDLFSIDEALENVETVYHCAGFVSFNRNQSKQLMEVNHEATRLLVNACLQKKINAFCHVSSLAAIHNLDHQGMLDETVFWKKSGRESDYALSKYNGEREVWRGMEEGLNAVVVNPGVILSPGFWEQSSSGIFNTCYKGNSFYTSGTTAYIAAKDVAQIMIKLTRGKHFGGRFILVEGNYSFRDIFTAIQKQFNKRPPFINAGRLILNLGWVAESFLAFFTGRRPVLTRSIINSALNKQLYSNEKIKQTINHSFMPVQKAIEQICSIYLSEKQGT